MANAEPLAYRMRAQQLTDYVGQTHLLKAGKPLYQAITQGNLHSMVFWGPPGCGKTTLANLAATHANAVMHALSAVLVGVKEIRQVTAEAEIRLKAEGIRTVLFVDEIHRFNKSQQDAFLPFVESGVITLIGATTENPSFSLNNALLSRLRVYVLKPLAIADLKGLLTRTLTDSERGLGKLKINFPEELQLVLLEAADGDARQLLNLLEMLADYAEASQLTITSELLNTALTKNLRYFDKQGDNFYDQISALHKSVRGSNPDAALYWLCRMLEAGCDPLYVARRVVRMASEDIGNADPRALEIALSAWQVQERLGSPEGELAIAQAVVYLAVAAKSNAVYVAFNEMMQTVKLQGNLAVPLHLRNAPTALMENLGYGKAYRYVHDEPHAYAAGENYLPEGMAKKKFYQPTERGLEAKIKEKLAFLAELDADTKC